VPDPVPDELRSTTSQSAPLAEVHAHVGADAVTATLPKLPSDDTDCAAGEIENVHGGGGAAWDTVNVCAPIVSVPVRAAAVFAAAVKLTVPLPVPEAPPVTVSHAAFAAAVHAQVFADAVTATEPDPPVSATFCPGGESVNVQVGGGGGGAACATANVFPAAAIVPVRALVVVFAATLNATLPLPVPDSPAVMLIHGALVVAVHAHVLADVVTAIEPVPPASAKFWVGGEIENVHAGGGAAA
jgi:hypothetical protein